MPDARGAYGYAILGRHGMGNMMLPWARCFLWCKDTGATMIAPSWRHLRLGPYLRRELDKRDYYRLWSGRGYVRGPERWIRLLASPKIEESQIRAGRTPSAGSIVMFRGMQTYFRDLRGRHSEILAEIRRIARVPLPTPHGGSGPSIGIHVRLGDFSTPTSHDQLHTLGHNWRLPIDWYLSALRELRAACGTAVPARVFSDGTPQELRELLSEPGVTLVPQGDATHDLILFSQCAILIASASTFSMWASFLGQRPTLWYPGQRREDLVLANVPGSLEPEYDAGHPLLPAFRAQVRAVAEARSTAA